MKKNKNKNQIKIRNEKMHGRIPATLTLEAALVMPLFLYLMIAFLYFIQIFILQERIQSAITQMGFSLAKTAYLYEEFSDGEEEVFDESIFGSDFDLNVQELTKEIAFGNLLKLYVVKYLDKDQMNRSGINRGFDGINFFDSKILKDENCIDIVAKYQVRIPVRIFLIRDLPMIQRVRLRAWTGHKVPAVYTIKEKDGDGEETIVYVTETGRVYHRNKTCSHIKLSVTSVLGIPSNLRNEHGAKYYPCEYCCSGNEGSLAAYFITSDGTRYHSSRDCPKIKRNVKEIPLSEVGNRRPCKRCCN